MRLYRFILDKVESNLAYLSSSESNHLKNVLRIPIGSDVIIFDLKNNIYFKARYLKDQTDCCVLELITTIEKKYVPRVKLFVALIKPDLNEFIVEKAVELGISEINIYSAKRSQEIIKSDNLEKKMSRFEKIAISAIKQCGSPLFPQINYYKNLESALELENNSENKLIFLAPDFENKDEEFKLASIETNLISKSKSSSTSVIIGPEGGLTKEEIELAFAKGYTPTTLGNTTLRVETAAIVALGNIVNRLYD